MKEPRRVPPITDEEIAEMRHITPILEENGMYRIIEGIEKIHPRHTSFLWDASPSGKPFTYTWSRTIITQHLCAYFFKPSLAEVYAWIRFSFPDNWQEIKHFCLNEKEKRIEGTTDYICECTVLAGKKMIYGAEIPLADGFMGYELVEEEK